MEATLCYSICPQLCLFYLNLLESASPALSYICYTSPFLSVLLTFFSICVTFCFLIASFPIASSTSSSHQPLSCFSYFELLYTCDNLHDLCYYCCSNRGHSCEASPWGNMVTCTYLVLSHCRCLLTPVRYDPAASHRVQQNPREPEKCKT